ncbi:MAG: DNA-directed RNA polymerase subunit omega [Thermoanaerobaculia bacterium]|jgi:DNA-directed RNA polymerase subunit K/omega|nr:DNA-directed RNA polymerase subunit omega [Thermoanaerobaculia bacterium]
MDQPNPSMATSGVDSKFRYVLVVSRRAEQLMRGARPKTDGPMTTKPVRAAHHEIDRRMVEWGFGSGPAADGEGNDSSAT